MATPANVAENVLHRPLPVTPSGMPIMYEDDEEGDMGESNPHVVTDCILRNGYKAHLSEQPQYRVFSNLNLYYSDEDPKAYVSPDTMIVTPFAPLGEDVSSYRIGEDGPAPVVTTEVLSERTSQQRDLDEKIIIYAQLGVAEYILVDVTGEYLPQRLLLKRLQPDGTYLDVQDADGGVTSLLGFRLIIDTDGRLRVLDAVTGKRYVRPDQAEEQIRELEASYQAEAAARQAEAAARQAEAVARQAEAAARQQAEEQNRLLQEELARLRKLLEEQQRPAT